MNRWVTRIVLPLSVLGTLSGSSLAPGQSSHEMTPKAGIRRVLRVPFDRQTPAVGTFELQYELGRRFNPSKPTVVIVADGQQFYVRSGTIAPLQDELFGDRFNVVGIIGRASNAAVLAKIRPSGEIDWQLAYRLLRSEEWVDDIEAVRQALVGQTGDISLYGRSGGGLLVDQYLAKYPIHVRTAFTQAAVNRFIDAEFRLNSDKFWEDIERYDPTLQKQVLSAVEAHPEDRARIFLLLQRQNFFVSPDELERARFALIRALSRWDRDQLKQFSSAYQVEPVLKQLESSSNPAANVRLFEFYEPLSREYEREEQSIRRIDPDIEVLRLFAAPLLRLCRGGSIASPSMNLSALNKVQGSVFLLAGYYDHTADYRSQLALASHFPHHHLLLLSDDHDFLALAKTGLYPELIQSALLQGADGQATQEVEEKLSNLRYSEF